MPIVSQAAIVMFADHAVQIIQVYAFVGLKTTVNIAL